MIAGQTLSPARGDHVGILVAHHADTWHASLGLQCDDHPLDQRLVKPLRNHR